VKLNDQELRREKMVRTKLSSRGFTLIASLLLMLLLSGVAIALLMMVNTEQRSGAADLSNNYTYRSTEGAMEKMTSDLANTFKSIQSPTAA
jgi:Tfp pilus assembly protein PilX